MHWFCWWGCWAGIWIFLCFWDLRRFSLHQWVLLISLLGDNRPRCLCVWDIRYRIPFCLLWRLRFMGSLFLLSLGWFILWHVWFFGRWIRGRKIWWWWVRRRCLLLSWIIRGGWDISFCWWSCFPCCWVILRRCSWVEWWGRRLHN